jgi:hypothetical protein
MGKVVAGGTVSLDGYIAGPNESGFEHLFAWFAGGDFEFPSLNPDVQFHLTEPDYRFLRDVVEGIGVSGIGRRLFDLTDGWGGRHPFDKPIVVVTHSVPERWVAAHPDAALHVRHGRAAIGHRAGAGDCGRPRARAARLRCALLRAAEGSADPPRWAGPGRRGVSRDPPALHDSPTLNQGSGAGFGAGACRNLLSCVR